MNYAKIAQAILLAVLIASPAIVLLAMQMPLWLPPPPDRLTLQPIAYANFGLPSIDREAASRAMTLVDDPQ